MDLFLGKNECIQLLSIMKDKCYMYDNCEYCSILELCHEVCGYNNPIDKLTQMEE